MDVIEHNRYVILYEDGSRGRARSWVGTRAAIRRAVAEKRLWPLDRLRPTGVEEESSC